MLIALAKVWVIGIHFPFLTFITLIAVTSGIGKFKYSNNIFLISGSLWIIFSSESIGFVSIFDSEYYGRYIVGIIPLLLAIGLVLSTPIVKKRKKFSLNKIYLIPILIIIGVGSLIYKPTLEEVNCWYYITNDDSYRVSFAKSPDRVFEVELSSEDLKNEVLTTAIKDKYREGYYCPETKIRVITSFGKIISAKIIAFRNSELNKNVKFQNPTKIPLEKVKGKLDILQPFMLTFWN